MRDRRGEDWRQYASRAVRGDSTDPLDVQALLRTMFDNWNDPAR